MNLNLSTGFVNCWTLSLPSVSLMQALTFHLLVLYLTSVKMMLRCNSQQETVSTAQPSEKRQTFSPTLNVLLLQETVTQALESSGSGFYSSGDGCDTVYLSSRSCQGCYTHEVEVNLPSCLSSLGNGCYDQ